MQPIMLTSKAVEQLKVLMQDAPEGAQGVRLNVVPRGCSGNAYQMEYIAVDDDVSDDEKFEQDGTALYIPKTHSWMLYGIEIDYVTDGVGNYKFSFVNPNETGRCGCGESFHLNPEQLAERQIEK